MKKGEDFFVRAAVTMAVVAGRGLLLVGCEKEV